METSGYTRLMMQWPKLALCARQQFQPDVKWLSKPKGLEVPVLDWSMQLWLSKTTLKTSSQLGKKNLTNMQVDMFPEIYAEMFDGPLQSTATAGN